MAEMDVFERRVADTLTWYAADVSLAVDAMAVAHRVALEHPRRRARALPWGPVAIPRLAWVLLLAGLLLALVVGSLMVGARRPDHAVVIAPSPTTAPSPTLEPTAASGGTLSVTVENLKGASGSRLAAILYKGVPLLAGGDTPLAGLGGFSADVTTDSFTVTELVRVGPPGFDRWPSFTGHPVASVPPGIHTLVIYVSKNLKGYTDWVPNTPVDRACVRFLTVPEGGGTGVTIPSQPLPDQVLSGLPFLDVCLQD